MLVKDRITSGGLYDLIMGVQDEVSTSTQLQGLYTTIMEHPLFASLGETTRLRLLPSALSQGINASYQTFENSFEGKDLAERHAKLEADWLKLRVGLPQDGKRPSMETSRLAVIGRLSLLPEACRFQADVAENFTLSVIQPLSGLPRTLSPSSYPAQEMVQFLDQAHVLTTSFLGSLKPGDSPNSIEIADQFKQLCRTALNSSLPGETTTLTQPQVDGYRTAIAPPKRDEKLD